MKKCFFSGLIMSLSLFLVVFVSCEASSGSSRSSKVSGKYNPQGDKSLYAYFEFNQSICTTADAFVGMRFTRPYEIKDNRVIISDPQGTLIFRIESKDVLVGEGWPIDGIRYIKE